MRFYVHAQCDRQIFVIRKCLFESISSCITVSKQVPRFFSVQLLLPKLRCTVRLKLWFRLKKEYSRQMHILALISVLLSNRNKKRTSTMRRDSYHANINQPKFQKAHTFHNCFLPFLWCMCVLFFFFFRFRRWINFPCIFSPQYTWKQLNPAKRM